MPIREGAEVSIVPHNVHNPRKRVTNPHGKVWAAVAVPGPDLRQVVPYNCIHNQEIAIINRSLGVVPPVTQDGHNIIAVGLRTLQVLLPRVSRNDFGVMPSRYSGNKREKYLQAERDVLLHGFKRSFAKLTMFVKGEKKDVAEKPIFDPRAIQFRDPRYCVLLGRYTVPIEEHIYSLSGDGTMLPKGRLVGKGLNGVERAAVLKHKMEEFIQPAVLSMDMSRFDKHVNVELLRAEHKVYLKMCPERELRTLLKCQLRNIGQSDQGLFYINVGSRASGDMNTALGNIIIMFIMVIGIMHPLRIHWQIFDDGDDVLIIVERKDEPLAVPALTAGFTACGMSAKLESVAYHLWDVDWCQSKPINAHGIWKFVRHPRKVVLGALMNDKFCTSVGRRVSMIKTVGLCELVLNCGVPVLQAFACMLIRNGGPHSLELSQDMGYYHRVKRDLRFHGYRSISEAKVKPITSEARTTFALAYHMSEAIQRSLEQYFDQLELPLGVVCGSALYDYTMQTWDYNCRGTNVALGAFSAKF